MRITAMLATAAWLGGQVLAQNPQINFWYTVGCHDNYANSDFPGQGAIQGGNFGSRAAAFITSGNFPCGKSHPGKFRAFICADPDCDNKRQVSVGTCVDDFSSVYAMWDCKG